MFSGNLQENGTNYDFLAQFVEELHKYNGTIFSNVDAHCLGTISISICSGSGYSHNTTSSNVCVFIYRVRETCGPHQCLSTAGKIKTNHFSLHSFKLFVKLRRAKSLL